jgi:glutathione S-transferase
MGAADRISRPEEATGGLDDARRAGVHWHCVRPSSQESPMKLYYNPLSTYSQKALIAFHEKGIPFERELVDFNAPESRAAFEAVYPIGKVPFLKASDDWNVPESTSIIEFLEDKFPSTPHLIPADREAARAVRFHDRMGDLYLNDPVAELLFQKLGFRPVNEDAAARARKHLAASYAYLDNRLASKQWLCDQFSMADCAAIPPLFYAQFVAPFDDRPSLSAYWKRAQHRASYTTVMREFVPIWEGMMNQGAAAKK